MYEGGECQEGGTRQVGWQEWGVRWEEKVGEGWRRN